MCGCVTWVTEPIGVVVEDEIATGRFVVDSTLWVTIVTVDVAIGATFEGFLTDNCRCTAKNIGRCCREDRCLNVEIDHGITVIVGNDINVEYSFCIETTWVEVIDTFNRWIVEIEWLDIANDFVIDRLLVPRVVAQRC